MILFPVRSSLRSRSLSRCRALPPIWPGQATVIDGDTIEIHGQRIRLYGIDARESGQTCTANGKVYRCDQQAKKSGSDSVWDEAEKALKSMN